MRFDLFLHHEKEPAGALSMERPVRAEAHVEGRSRVRDCVYYVVDLSQSCAVSAMDVSRGRDMTCCWDLIVILMMVV